LVSPQLPHFLSYSVYIRDLVIHKSKMAKSATLVT